jgi:hypothetical protein
VVAVCFLAFREVRGQKDQARENEISATFGKLITPETKNSVSKVRIRNSNTIFFARGSRVTFDWIVPGLGFSVAIVPKRRSTWLPYFGPEVSRMIVNITIRDIDGSPVAIVDGDYWKVYKAGYDYNNDDYGFEVLTPDKRVIFQLDLKDDIVEFAGLLLTDKGDGLYWAGDKVWHGAWMWQLESGEFHGVPFEIPKDTIAPIFMHPRELYVHERIAN